MLSINVEANSLMARRFKSFLPPLGLHAFSRTAGGILEPLRKPGMETLEATVERTLS